MSDLTSRVRPVFKSGQCIGHVLRHAKGHDAHNRDNQLLGTFRTAYGAIGAVLTSMGYST